MVILSTRLCLAAALWESLGEFPPNFRQIKEKESSKNIS